MEQGVGEAPETSSDQPSLVRNRSDSSGSDPSARPGYASGSSMRPDPPVATGSTTTMTQPRPRKQNPTSATNALSG